MKIALINGSPKIRGSASSSILQELNALLADCNDISTYHFWKSSLSAEEIDQLTENDVLVFAFPLYVDGIPSHLLNCLVQLEAPLAALGRKKMVYAVVNCGFYEGHQARVALEIMENWCVKAGCQWGQGIGVGAGPMISSLANVPQGKGPMKKLGKALNQLANNVSNGASGETTYLTASFPRVVYKLIAELSMRQAIKANGLKPKDLYLRK